MDFLFLRIWRSLCPCSRGKLCYDGCHTDEISNRFAVRSCLLGFPFPSAYLQKHLGRQYLSQSVVYADSFRCRSCIAAAKRMARRVCTCPQRDIGMDDLAWHEPVLQERTIARVPHSRHHTDTPRHNGPHTENLLI